MKYLLICLLAGSLVSPAWSQEYGMELKAFIEKLGNAKPWTLEKVEKEFGMKFTYTSSTGFVRRHVAYGKPVAAKNLPVEDIIITILEENNEARYLMADIDSDSSCLTREEIQTLYPKGFLDASHAFPAGGLLYFIGRPWGVVVFNFGANSMERECLLDISVEEDHQVNEFILKELRSQK